MQKSMSLNDTKRQLGVYYTPIEITDLLSRWAIRDASDLVLEPSFGGCGFLKSAANRLQALGCTEPQQQLYGCDIDAGAFEHLSQTFGKFVDLAHFEKRDFLTHSGNPTWPLKFDAVIGNPPYLPYRKIDFSTREFAIRKLADIGITLDLRSSMWAYFVALGLCELGNNGRIAWVLPGSFLHANYSKILRSYIKRRFRDIRAFVIKERLFLYEGTEEQTVVLLADGYHPNSECESGDDIGLTVCDDVDELRDTMDLWQQGELKPQTTCATPVYGLLDRERQSLLTNLSNHETCRRFGDFADVRIGLVTGDNKFFVITPDKAKEHHLDAPALPAVLSKFAFAKGLEYTNADRSATFESNNRCLLIVARDPNSDDIRLNAYLDTFPKDKIKTLSTFKKRLTWCNPDDGRPPQAFFPVMHHLGPRLVLNDANINCTNTLHRVYFKDIKKISQKQLMALSMLSTFSQISAEIVGRKYGAGVLKHEPREAEEIRLLLPPDIHWHTIGQKYRQVDALLRNGDLEGARHAVDRFLLLPVVGDRAIEVQALLDSILAEVRQNRQPNKSNG